jgi:Raf kinase inhibitor-like YbhB/YbcL family protein
MTFVLRGPRFSGGKRLPKVFVQSAMAAGGDNVSPELERDGAPEGTKSFAPKMYAPDASTGSGWWHWAVNDVPAMAVSLLQGAGAVGAAKLPSGSRMARTDFGTKEYGGAAPPPGQGPHRYVFTRYALNVDKLDVDEAPSAAYIHFATAVYERALHSSWLIRYE